MNDNESLNLFINTLKAAVAGADPGTPTEGLGDAAEYIIAHQHDQRLFVHLGRAAYHSVLERNIAANRARRALLVAQLPGGQIPGAPSCH